MIRNLLVPIRGDGKGEDVLAHAAALALRYGAHVKAAHCRPRPEDLNPFGVPVPAFLRDQFIKQAMELADAEERRLRGQFDALVAKIGLRVVEEDDGVGASVSWCEESGRQVDVIKTHGRLTDLIVVAKPDRDRNLGANTLKAALFNTGRPVLMCPPGPPPEGLGARVALAWNGSLEAARAVALCLDVLRGAEDVVVLTGGAPAKHGARAEDLMTYLRLRGVDARQHRFEARRRIGEALLREARAAGADMLIMGAYGDSHERETLFGGNTQIVVDEARMPVALVH